MKKKIGTIFAVILILAGIGVMLVPTFFQNQNKGVQQDLTSEYEKIVSENENKEQMPTAEPQQENYVYEEADFLEENSNEDTKAIIARQKILGLITCEKLNLKFVVVEGATRDNIRATIGHITGTAGMGGKGNCVLAGHRGGYYGEFFEHIDKLENGDEVVLTDLYNRSYTYEVYKQFVVEATETWICDPIEDEDTLTLLSCEDNGTKRIIVRCRLKVNVHR